MRITINVLLLIFAFSFNLQGQNSAIKGKVVYETSHRPVDSLRVDLLDSLENVIRSINTDSLGNYWFGNIESGVYNLFVENNGSFPHKVINILAGKIQEVEINLTVKEPCKNSPNIGVCPYCLSSKNVLRISPGTVVSLNFGENKRAERRNYRRIIRKGYRTFTNDKLEEIVIQMYIESEKDKFYDFCHKWFCVKCKKVF